MKYKRNLVTLGGTKNQKTEVMERNSNGTFVWTTLESDFEFSERSIESHSLVNIESSHVHEEYILLIGGMNFDATYMYTQHVFKFNGTWFPFGQLSRPRAYHSSIFWNGAVYVIGGRCALSYWTSDELSFGSSYSSSYPVDELQYKSGYEVDKEHKVSMEIWKIQDSPNQFTTTENWPDLFDWEKPHLFIVADSFFPDH